jgi:hypothetical protein
MSNEKLHERATEILEKQGVSPDAATADQYRKAAEEAQAEGVEYETPQTPQTLADLDRALEQERQTLLVEFELGQMGVTMETATNEQLHEAVAKAGETIEAAKQT